MGRRTWIYVVVLLIVLIGAGAFFWWIYKSGGLKPKAAVTPTPSPTTFVDVPADYWAYNEIEGVNKAGYMTGLKQFRPEEVATRATLAVAVGRAYNKTANPQTPSFPDVATTYWAYPQIEGLKAAGWMDGFADGTFRPEAQLDRATIAVVLARAVAGSEAAIPASNTQTFTDVAPTYWAHKHIEYCVSKGILSGYGDGTFRPDNTTDRATVAVGVSRALAGGDANIPTPTATTFDDVPSTYWAYKHIEYANAQGFMTGYGLSFLPEVIADRATTAVVIARVLAGSEAAIPAGPATPSYSDVKTDFWAYKHIEYVKTKNVMTGYGDGTFRPTENAQRYTEAIILARAKGLDVSNPPATPSFVDVPTSSPYYADVEAVYKAGYTKGCRTEGTSVYFCPTDALTRATLAVFTYNAYLRTSTSPSPALSPSPRVSPSLSPSPRVSPSLSPSPSPSIVASPSILPSPTASGGTGGTTGGTGTAQTGAEIPLVSGGVLGILFAARYFLKRYIQ